MKQGSDVDASKKNISFFLTFIQHFPRFLQTPYVFIVDFVVAIVIVVITFVFTWCRRCGRRRRHCHIRSFVLVLFHSLGGFSSSLSFSFVDLSSHDSLSQHSLSFFRSSIDYYLFNKSKTLRIARDQNAVYYHVHSRYPIDVTKNFKGRNASLLLVFWFRTLSIGVCKTILRFRLRSREPCTWSFAY